ncbi:MAG: hypothetical protein WC828_01630 [Thermoleophilia bacterium]|jgi:hypothetical protein
MISVIKDRVSTFLSLFQERPVYTVALAMGMSALLAGISLYLFVFAGRSLLPAPLAGDAPVTPHTTSVPVQIVSLGQPAAQPPESPPQEETVPEQQIVTGISNETDTAVASASSNPVAEKSDDGHNDAHNEDNHAVVSNVEHQSENHAREKKKED